ncbi:hypothetical protein EX30DRAFT_363783 [Ascodesmis nigricans]|uniref:Uncharacterized protein n=1 Tax=Ascodesmis nigricans TaxID=341454 RepID=A0A4S2MXT4_9PEZI|nr:hypothetical protein EX30DRAFT_363783 [Ascodesmis nigricans]
MFNRLPIYTRPKEPAIGGISRPVLQSSTNEDVINSLGSLTLQTYDLNGRPRNTSSALGPGSESAPSHDRHGYSPTSLVRALEDEPQRRVPRRPVRPDEPRATTPQSITPRAQSPIYNPQITHRPREDSLSSATFPHTLRSNSPPAKKFNVTRKPAPPMDGGIYDGIRPGGGFTGTTITAITGGANQQPKSGGFANLKDKVVGRTRRPSRASPTTDSDSEYDRNDWSNGNKMLEIPSDDEATISVKPPNMMLIDEWLSDREKLHKRSTISTVATRQSRADNNDRTGVPPGEFLPIPEPTMPLIPAHFLPRSSSKQPPTSSKPTSRPSPPPPQPFSRPPPSMAQVEAPPPSAPPATSRHQVSRDAPHHSNNYRDITPTRREVHQQPSPSPLPPRTDSRPKPPSKPPTPPPAKLPTPPPSEPPQPKDRVQLLEEQQTALELHKHNLKKEIHNLEQLLPPNITSHPRGTKEEMMEQMEILNRAVADVEKELYEVGMKLHRAYRRYEKTTGSEGPTHLWISRVMARKEEQEGLKG